MIGKVIGPYRITGLIGEGGMGTVYKGIDEMLDREVAIKSLRPELLSDPQYTDRFRKEAITLAKLNHPNIAMLYSFLPQGNNSYMVMEYVKGESLDVIIRQRGPLSLDYALRLFVQAAEGIGHAHRSGIIHRDIKPSNIMVDGSGTVKVMDFGIARILGSSRLTRAGAVVGTLEYLSPEQIQGLETGIQADIYSLGVLLFEMLTGRLPFQSQNEFELLKAHINTPPPSPRLFIPNLPEHIELAILKALSKRPEDRFSSTLQFCQALSGEIHTQDKGDVRFLGSPPNSQNVIKETRVVPNLLVPAQEKILNHRSEEKAQGVVNQKPNTFPPALKSNGSSDRFEQSVIKVLTGLVVLVVVVGVVVSARFFRLTVNPPRTSDTKPPASLSINPPSNVSSPQFTPPPVPNGEMSLGKETTMDTDKVLSDSDNNKTNNKPQKKEIKIPHHNSGKRKSRWNKIFGKNGTLNQE